MKKTNVLMVLVLASIAFGFRVYLVAEPIVCPPSPVVDVNDQPWLDQPVMHAEVARVNAGQTKLWELVITGCDEDPNTLSLDILDGPTGAVIMPHPDPNAWVFQYAVSDADLGENYWQLVLTDEHDANDVETVALQVLLNKPPVMGCRRR
jgi:hypothetical protein